MTYFIHYYALFNKIQANNFIFTYKNKYIERTYPKKYKFLNI